MSIDATAQASLSIDPRGLGALKRDARAGADSPETLRAVAKQFESLFAQMLIRNMRAASLGEGLMDSEQSEFYQDIFDQQMAVELSNGRGLGLADVLLRQLSGPGEAPAAAGAAAAVAGPRPPERQSVSRVEFVRELWPHAEAAGRALGVDPATIVSHAALETGWGRSLPRQADGQSSFNLFGIKSGRGWQGATARSSTLEYVAAAPVRSVEEFRAYESVAGGVADYARLLGTSPRYAAAVNTGSNVAAFAGALQRAGYATDPHYARKLEAVAAQVRSYVDPPTALKVAAAGPLNPATGTAT